MTRILLVDDHLIVLRGLRLMLSEAFEGARFGEAINAEQALELLGSKRFDLVLIDINLPGRDGLWLLGEARRLHPRVPALVVSAYPEEEFAVRCLRGGAAGYVTKDSAPDELAAAVRKVLDGGKYVTAILAERLAAVVGGDFVLAHEGLSSREMQVLRLVAEARSLREIAAELKLSDKTVATYRARIAVKLGLSTNVELTRYALRHKIVT